MPIGMKRFPRKMNRPRNSRCLRPDRLQDTMKKTVFYLTLVLSISCLTSCAPFVHHADPFYDFNDNDFPRNYLPLLNPFEATRKNSSSPWSVSLLPYGPWVHIPNSDADYPYSSVTFAQSVRET